MHLKWVVPGLTALILLASGCAASADLAEFQAALEADDATAAAPLAERVHESQHGLSHEIDEWLGTAAGESHEG